jgi:hypothetical protein
MCNGLRALRQSMATYAGQFDARSLSARQAGEVVRLCAQIEASAASIKALAAARSAETKGWERNGYRSASEQLADQAGMSPAAAKRALETGRRMAEQPEVASAALAGELSLEQATAVSDGVAADPAQAGELIDKAKRSSLPELNEEVARIKAARSNQEERRRALHAKRSFRRWTDRDGALQAHLYGHPEDGARLWRTLDPIRRRLNLLRRQTGAPNDTLDALDYDAMMTLAAIAAGHDGELSFADLLGLGLFPQSASSPPPPPPATADDTLFSTTEATQTETSAPPSPTTGPRAKKLAGSPIRLMIRVDLDALLRGVPLEGELCEIAGYGPVPVSVIEDLLGTENPFIIGLLTNSQELIGVYHHGRHPNAHQRSALDFLYPTCAAQGCSSRAGLQYDHRQDFAKTKITAFDLLDRLCGHHHRKKTHQGWALTDGRGKRPFVPPDDPRHPRHSQSRDPTGPSPPNRSP